MSITGAAYHILFSASWGPVQRFELLPTFPDTLEGANSCARARFL